jgi:acetylglutamate kinase
VNSVVIKVGGNELDDPAFVERFIAVLVRMTDPRPVLVHGGGKEIAALQKQLGLVPAFVEGLRVTDAESLRVAEMVLSGTVNKRLVARLVAGGAAAVGLSGVDLGLIRVEKMLHAAGDLGFVGAVKEINAQGLQALLTSGFLPVVSPISLGFDGQTYNVNADHAALGLARGLGARSLLLVTNVAGVMANGCVLERLGAAEAEALIADGTISGGMVPKVRSALEAVSAGVPEAVITDVAGLEAIAEGGRAGTAVVRE